MASRSRNTSGSTANKVLWFLFVGGLIFAFFQIPYDPGVKGVTGILQSKAETVKTWAEGVGPAIGDKIGDIMRGGSEQPAPGGGGTGGGTDQDGGTPSETTPDAPSDAVNALNGLVIADGQKVAYNRDDWKHWVDVRSCWTTREAVLARDAVPGTLVMKTKNGKETSNVDEACEIVSGKWVDPYSGKEFTNPKDLDIDHMVPLKYTAQHGGQDWDANRKQEYANSLNGGHLLAVSASENRSKSDKGPGSWKPSNQNYYCDYAKNWISVSSTWGLTITQSDANALNEMLATC